MFPSQCPKCKAGLNCLGGCSAHPSNWYCSDEKHCGWQAWNPENKPKVIADSAP
jgi:hypothetical protein